MTDTVLVVGGAGYIGSQVVLDLLDAGYNAVVVDNFSTGNDDIAQTLSCDVVTGDILDGDFIRKTLDAYSPSAVMHFAAFALVGESVTEPHKYYLNNVAATLELLTAMKEREIQRFIFSSTCATYGVPERVPIDEEVSQAPINPYGRSKLMVEQILKDFDDAYGMKHVIFRYFNAAGAHPSGKIGERHEPESHIIPLALRAAHKGSRFKVFGDDYDSPDGTCIRDYIHVADISQAHIKGLKALERGGVSSIYNIGNGSGYSVLEVLETIGEVTGKKVEYDTVDRRAGDPPRLVADAKKIIRELSWKPEYPDLKSIVETAWNWHKKDWTK